MNNGTNRIYPLNCPYRLNHRSYRIYCKFINQYMAKNSIDLVNHIYIYGIHGINKRQLGISSHPLNRQ